MEELRITLCIIFAVFVAVILKILINFGLKCRTLPPGPWGLPFIGYVPWLGKKPYKTFVKLAEKYGNVFSVTINGDTRVILNDWQSIKETLVDQPKVFSGRIQTFMSNALSNSEGIGFSEGPLWKIKRNTSIQILRNIGMGKKSMESNAAEIVQEIIDTLNQADGQTLNMGSVIFRSIIKVNWKLISGDNIGTKSFDIETIEKFMLGLMKTFGTNDLLNLFPLLRFLPPNGMGFWQIKRLNKMVRTYLKRIIDDHEANYNDGESDDYIDYYLSEIKKQQSESKLNEPPFNHSHLLSCIWSLFSTAVDTTNGTSSWGFLYLALYPRIQKKIQDEMDKVVGRYRSPTMSDMSNLPYFNAFIMETHRFASLAPLSIPHKTTEDTVIRGYKIPKGTTCMQNIYAVHNDPRLWDEPEIFKPERFLDQNNKIISPPYFMPFSTGPRQCIGQSIAEMELRVIFSSVLQKFTVSAPPGHPPLSLNAVEGLLVKAKPYSLFIQKRI